MTWVWTSSRSWWWTGKPGLLQSIGSQSQTQLSSWTEQDVNDYCLTLWDPMDWSPPGSSVHGIFQAGILEWVAISFSRDQTWISCVCCSGRWILYRCAAWKAQCKSYCAFKFKFYLLICLHIEKRLTFYLNLFPPCYNFLLIPGGFFCPF